MGQPDAVRRGLTPRYRELYGDGAYAPKAYRQSVAARVAALARRHGVGALPPGEARRRPVRRTAVKAWPTAASASPTTNSRAEQPTLL